MTGTVSAWLLLGFVDALVDTASGQLVIVKVIGFAALVSLGWVNRTRLIPLLGRVAGVAVPAVERSAVLVGGGPPTRPEAVGAHPDDRGDSGAVPREPADGVLARLLQVVRVEVVIGALVLAVTAGLVNQPPGRDVLAQPFTGPATVDGSTLLFEVDPARAGTNEMHLYITDETGNPASVDALEVRTGRDGVPERKLPVEQISPDHAVVYGASLPTPGTWEVDVTTVRVGVPRQFHFEVPGPMIRSPFSPVRTMAALVAVVAALVLALGVASTPAGAHGGPGRLETVTAERGEGQAVDLVVRLTWVNGGDPVADATVTAVVGDAAAVPLAPGDEAGLYQGVVEAPSESPIRVTSVEPVVTLEVTAPAAAATTATEGSTTTATTEAPSSSSTEAPTTTAPETPTNGSAVLVEDDDDGLSTGALVAMGVGVAAAVAIALGAALKFNQGKRR